MNNRISKWPARLLCAGALLATSAIVAPAHAQGGGGQGGQGGGGGRGNFQNMTPEQRAQMMQQFQERRQQQQNEWLKQAMTASGLTDTAAQDAVVNYITERDKTYTSLREMAQALSTKLTDSKTTDDTFKTDLAAFRAAVAAAQAKQTADLATLDGVVKYSTNPRVESLLTVLGVIGPEITYLGGIGTVFPNSPYGAMGGRGMGGRGGMGGGQGGQGGGQGGQGGGRRRGGGGGNFGGGQGGGGAQDG